MTLDTTSASKAFTAMKIILSNMRGHTGIPSTYVIHQRILPSYYSNPTTPGYSNFPYGHPQSPYASVDDKLTQCTPILMTNNHEWHDQFNFEPLEETRAKHCNFLTNNKTVLNTLFAY
jgi:hypothetical protein